MNGCGSGTDEGRSCWAALLRRPIPLLGILALCACATDPATRAPVDPFMAPGTSVLFEAQVQEENVAVVGVLEFLASGDVKLSSRSASCRPRETNPLRRDDVGGPYGPPVILPAQGSWLRWNSSRLRILCGGFRLTLERRGDDVLQGMVEIQRTESRQVDTNTCRRYFVDPRTGERGPCLEYEKRTVTERVWSRGTVATLTVRSPQGDLTQPAAPEPSRVEPSPFPIPAGGLWG